MSYATIHHNANMVPLVQEHANARGVRTKNDKGQWLDVVLAPGGEFHIRTSDPLLIVPNVSNAFMVKIDR